MFDIPDNRGGGYGLVWPCYRKVVSVLIKYAIGVDSLGYGDTINFVADRIADGPGQITGRRIEVIEVGPVYITIILPHKAVADINNRIPRVTSNIANFYRTIYRVVKIGCYPYLMLGEPVNEFIEKCGTGKSLGKINEIKCGEKIRRCFSRPYAFVS